MVFPKLLKRIRHTRGHGVHSPFVYSLVRDVFMRRRLSPGGERRLHDELVVRGVKSAVAVELQNLKNLYPHACFTVLGLDVADSDVAATLDGARDGTIAVISSRDSGLRAELCRQAVERANCLSVERRKYTLFFHDKRLPNQHFSL